MPLQMDKLVQIAPHSLAVVLSHPDELRGHMLVVDERLQEHRLGYEVFADFKAENMQHFWNRRVTEAIAETFFLGWIDEHVLLIQGKEEHLGALREGWVRRALRPPQGFAIKYLGDVSPISMSPISQSQFIPLGEILCLAISAMNSSRKPVTQEALMEHLTTCFPGVPTPSPEILRHTLNMLVRERKIYPTPDGYFIVTPQTYFITPTLIRTNSKWYHLDERIPDRSQCTSPQPGTITPSPSGCIRDRTLPKSHCDSCHCCREDMHSMHASTLQRKSPKDCKDSYCPPSMCQVPPTEKSKSTVNFSYKAETLTKSKDGDKPPKKFGLKLFRLSFKKDKTKQLATFSAQFPPEEWPLRDEETPSTIPRDVEVEIIRRINPDLTVENVVRHTALMKRLEEEKAQRSKAGSSAHHSSRSKKSRNHRKAHGKSRSHSKTRASKASDGSHLDVPGEREYEFYNPRIRSPREGCFIMERKGGDHFFVHSNPNLIESHFPVTPEWDVSGELAKRRTEMPFPEPSRGSSHSKVHRSHSHTQDRRSRNERSNKAKERSRSMDNSKGPLGGTSLGTPEDIVEGFSPDDRTPSLSYIDDNTLRPSQSLTHERVLMYKEACTPDLGNGIVETPNSCNFIEQDMPPESVPSYSDLNACTAKVVADDYFQCNTSSETILTAPSPMGKKKEEYEALTLCDGIKRLSPCDRQPQHLAREPLHIAREPPHTAREPPHTAREPPHTPRESQHTPRESQHTPRESQHTPRESQHTPRESQHTPRESQHTPREHTPREHTPRESQHTPREHTPRESQHTPREHTPRESQHTPREHTPREHTPREHTPREHTPREHTPREHTPREHTPREHTPREHTPREHTPREHTPREHTPREHTPRESQHTPRESQHTPRELTPRESQHTPRESQHIGRELGDYKEEPSKLPSCGPASILSGQAPELVANGRLVQHHNADSISIDKRKELFSKDTLFKPLHNTLSVNNFHKPLVPLLKSHQKTPTDPLPISCENFEQPIITSVTPTLPVSQRQQETSGNQEASFDYYNVSDDDESEEGTQKNVEEEKNRDDVGTMQWLLEREKERDLQRKFEKNLTLLNPKETENSSSQRATHSARLDSMDSSSITVDSGFNSPRFWNSFMRPWISALPQLSLSPPSGFGGRKKED
ncbi:storkhead-box protein 2 isoform X2 [Lissotriton helveticus]